MITLRSKRFNLIHNPRHNHFIGNMILHLRAVVLGILLLRCDSDDDASQIKCWLASTVSYDEFVTLINKS